MTDFLGRVVVERRAYVARARSVVPEDRLLTEPRALAARPDADLDGTGPDAHADAFTRALRLRRASDDRLAVIAEVKRVSPALGTLAADVDPARQARRYVAGGAAAISVLTEPEHWGGSLRDLAAVREALPDTPILCKDVIVSTYQIAEARAAGADAVLLIAEALTDAELLRLAGRAGELGMGVLVEAHETAAFARAVATAAPVVGVNARSLRRPVEIDRERAAALGPLVRDAQVLVAESGLAGPDDARALPPRVDAVLVGTALMRADDPASLIRAIASIGRRDRERAAVGEASR